jgi:hypothetical protein
MIVAILLATFSHDNEIVAKQHFDIECENKRFNQSLQRFCDMHKLQKVFNTTKFVEKKCMYELRMFEKYGIH